MSKKKVPSELLISQERIAERIYFIQDQKVMLDEDLAELYGVAPKRLNEQVTRNIDRFPEDFMFRLSREESGALRSQSATLKGRGQHRKYYPRAFTEHRHSDAFQCPSERAGGPGEYRDHAGLCHFSRPSLNYLFDTYWQ